VAGTTLVMRRLAVALQLGVALCGLAATSAGAQPGSGPRETVDQRFTTARPNTPTGASFTGSYHAAGNPKANPPYMRRMTFYPPAGMRYDTSVPTRCTASDAELRLQGAAACPPDSRLGGGKTQGIFYEPLANAFVFTTYDNAFDIFNNANEQVMVIASGGLGYTVVRGRIGPDQSVTYASPTCFPAPPAGQCARDYVLQLGSKSSMAPYTRSSRGYFTTPPKCPARGYWRTRVKFWWADGSIDTVATDQPCKRPRRKR
jgi:hypothetical protein